MPILVVDDNEDNVELMLDLLEDEGYTSIKIAYDGYEALETLHEQAPVDLVLLDVNMPRMNGFEVLEKIKQSETLRDIPVVMVTALDDLGSAIRCIEAGAEDYLTKPVEESLLMARVMAGLERKYLRNRERGLFREVEAERAKADELLFEVIPEHWARRLKKGEKHVADALPEATVFFSDFVGFTKLSSMITPRRLLHLLNRIFRIFDRQVMRHRMEKIKTIGDAYLAVGGLPPNQEDHAVRCMQFAIAILREVAIFNQYSGMRLQLRIGISTGPIVAGVIGEGRFNIDVWGETVTLAHQMEAQGLPDRIHVTDSTVEQMTDRLRFEPHQEIRTSQGGRVKTYLLSDTEVGDADAMRWQG